MTVHTPPEQFTANGNVRVVDILTSIANELRGSLNMRPSFKGGGMGKRERDQLIALEDRVRRLAETIERGK